MPLHRCIEGVRKRASILKSRSTFGKDPILLAPNDYFPPFSEQEYANRRRTIRASMKEKGLDALIVYGAYHWGGTDTGQVNAVYLSNYTAIPHSYVVLPLEADPTLFISFAYHITNAKDCAAIEDVRVAGSIRHHRASP